MMRADRRTFMAGVAGLLLPSWGAPGAANPAPPTIAEAAAHIRARRLTPVALVQTCLARIERLQPTLNAFITVLPGRALEQARALEAELAAGRWRGPLHGIPLALKDNIDTAGVRTTAAAAGLSARVPAMDAEVVRRLEAAGAVLLGKLNMDECAYGVASVSGHFGPVRNPWSTAHVAGGSSGGAAAAVAAGLCLGALGTDTGGSIRQPAAWCGITGFKPSYGLVSTRGVLPLSWSMDHVGPMCRSAEDAALLLAAIAGHDPEDPGSLKLPEQDYAGWSGRRLRVLRLARVGSLFAGLDPDVARATEVATGELEALTRPVAAVELPPVPRLSLIFVESASYLGPLLEQSPDGFSPAIRMLVETGQRITATRYAEDRRQLDRARKAVHRLFDEVDLLVMPTTPDLPMTVEQALAPAAGFGPPLSARNTTPFNVFGLPVISIPCGFSAGGLPIGLQIAGRPGGDAQVLALARAWQQRSNWHRQLPAGLA